MGSKARNPGFFAVLRMTERELVRGKEPAPSVPVYCTRKMVLTRQGIGYLRKFAARGHLIQACAGVSVYWFKNQRLVPHEALASTASATPLVVTRLMPI